MSDRSGQVQASACPEALIPLSKIPEWLCRLGYSRRLHKAVPYRWWSTGVLLPSGERIRLVCLKFGRSICTTPGALVEFAARLGEGGSFRRRRRSARPQSRPPEQRDRDVAAAEGRLTDAGI